MCWAGHAKQADQATITSHESRSSSYLLQARIATDVSVSTWLFNTRVLYLFSDPRNCQVPYSYVHNSRIEMAVIYFGRYTFVLIELMFCVFGKRNHNSFCQ